MSFGHRNRRGALRNARIEFRVTEDEKEIIETAAHISGQSVSAFGLPSVVKAAQELLEKQGYSILHTTDWQSLITLLEGITKPTPETKQMLKRLKAGRRVAGSGGDVYILDVSEDLNL